MFGGHACKLNSLSAVKFAIALEQMKPPMCPADRKPALAKPIWTGESYPQPKAFSQDGHCEAYVLNRYIYIFISQMAEPIYI